MLGTKALVSNMHASIKSLTKMAAKPPSGDRSDSFASDIKDASSDEYSLGTPTRIEPVKESTKRPEGAMGDAILRFLGIRKGPPRFDPDAVSRVSNVQ